jgi:hypothetical protein
VYPNGTQVDFTPIGASASSTASSGTVVSTTTGGMASSSATTTQGTTSNAVPYGQGGGLYLVVLGLVSLVFWMG